MEKNFYNVREDPQLYTQSYKRYALMVLSLVYLLSFMDRFMIGLFMQPIKEEFQLSDTQLGFLTGIAFALFYATLGIPIARWADRGNRVTITSIAIALWGCAVMLCGVVTNFVQLVLARIGSAVGEAGVMPPAYSLIADYFPVAERARAVSIYMIAIPVSILISLLFAGWIAEHYDWRIAFLLVGISGPLSAILVKCTLREPRGQKLSQVASAVTPLPFGEVIGILWRQKSFRYLLIGITLVNFVGIGVGQWYAPFFIRHHGMTLGDLGLCLGLITGLGGAVGIYLGGYIADRYVASDVAAQIRLASLVPMLSFLLTLAVLLSPIRELTFFFLLLANIVGWLAAGPMFTLILQLVEDRMRATAMAILSLALNLIGMGLGPQTVGILSDGLSSYLSTDSLRVAMMISSLACFGAAYYFWIAARTVDGDLLKAQSAIPRNAIGGCQENPA